MKKEKIANFLWFAGSALVGATVSIGVFYTVKFVIKNIDTQDKNQNTDVTDFKRGEPISLLRNDPNNRDVNVDLIEYKYKNKSFLGKEGLRLLNQKINESLPFGSEIFQLKHISFNNVYSLPRDTNYINGQYNPFTMELDIDVRKAMNNEISWSEKSLRSRVEYVFSTILHEYGHHLANTYITSIQKNDPLNWNYEQNNRPFFSIVNTTDSKRFFAYKNIPNIFAKLWMNSLNYDNFKYSEIENNQIKSTIYSKYSSYDLFEAANYGYSPLSNSNEKFSVSTPIEKFSENLSNIVNYSYGWDELLARNLTTFNYLIPNANKLSLYEDYYDYFFYKYGYDNNTILLNSYAPDIFQRNLIQKNSKNIYEQDENKQIFSVDNIFGGNLILWNRNSFEIKGKYNKILESYKKVFGYGKLISQIYMDNSNNKFEEVEENGKIYWKKKSMNEKDFNKIRIGGYLEKNTKIKALVINIKENKQIIHKKINFEKIISPTSLKTKSNPLAEVYVNSDEKYNQYISEEIDLNDIDINKIISICYWEDGNNNNEINLNENEIKNILEDQTSVSIRTITSFRESFKIILDNGEATYYSIKDTKDKNIYNLVFNSENKLVFQKMKN